MASSTPSGLSRLFPKWDLALSLAWQDIKDRFSRTVLGPFWIVISNAMLVIGITIVFGALFKTPIADFLVYVSLGIALWTFLSTVMTGASSYLESGKNILFTYNVPWSMQITRKVFVEGIVLAIHLLVAIPVILIAQKGLGLVSFISIFGIFMNLMFAYGLALIIASYGVRYSDLSHALESIMLFLFLFTPVFWLESALGPTRSAFVHYNPLFHFLEVVRGPILDQAVPVDSFIIGGVVSVGTLAIGIFIYMKRRSKIGMWMQ